MGKEKHAGPLALLYAANAGASSVVVTPAVADEKGRQRAGAGGAEDQTLEEIHDFLANLTLILIGFHIAGVLLASLVHRENLIGAMITGYKRPNLPDSQ
jgi:cytochrome b